MREFQKNNLLAALKQADWKVSGPGGAAELLGVKPTTLADRIRTFGVRQGD
jgi:transcriptional regulator with GAF, ATPase, and Fis domain